MSIQTVTVDPNGGAVSLHYAIGGLFVVGTEFDLYRKGQLAQMFSSGAAAGGDLAIPIGIAELIGSAVSIQCSLAPPSPPAQYSISMSAVQAGKLLGTVSDHAMLSNATIVTLWMAFQ